MLYQHSDRSGTGRMPCSGSSSPAVISTLALAATLSVSILAVSRGIDARTAIPFAPSVYAIGGYYALDEAELDRRKSVHREPYDGERRLGPGTLRSADKTTMRIKVVS